MKKKVIMGFLLACIGLAACGQTVDEQSVDESGAASADADTSGQAMAEAEKDFFDEVDAHWNVYVCEEDEDSVRTMWNEYAVADWEEMEKLLTQSEPVLNYPSFIPDGYEFEGGTVDYYLTEEDWETLEPEETLTTDSGSVQYKYVLPDSTLEKLRGYCLEYKNQEGQTLQIRATYESTIYLCTTGEELEAVESDAFERAYMGVLDNYYYGEFRCYAEPIYESSKEGDITENKAILYVITMSDKNNEQVPEMVKQIAESIQ